MQLADYRIYLWAGLIIVMAALVMATIKLQRRLREHHPGVYARLGRPADKPKDMFTIKRELKYIGFIVLRRYRFIDGPTLRKLGDVSFALYVLAIALVVVISFAEK